MFLNKHYKVYINQCFIFIYSSKYKTAEVSGVLDSPGAHAGPVPPIDVLLDLNPAKGQAKVMSGRCGAAGTPE